MVIRPMIVGAFLAVTGSAAAADCAAPGHGTRRVTAGDFAVQFVTQPADIAIGRHFDVLVTVCRDGAPFRGRVDVDADMPAHGHGMNYAPDIVDEGAGKVRASGMMFHMPGEWRYVFTLDGETGREVLEVRDDVR